MFTFMTLYLPHGALYVHVYYHGNSLNMKMNNIKLILICFVFVSQFGNYMADDDRRSKEELADDVSGKVFHINSKL